MDETTAGVASSSRWFKPNYGCFFSFSGHPQDPNWDRSAVVDLEGPPPGVPSSALGIGVGVSKPRLALFYYYYYFFFLRRDCFRPKLS